MLLLDEPAAGVPKDESAELFDAIAGLSRSLTILFIEHDMDVVFRFASRIIVMVGGRILVEGTPDEICARRARARGLPWQSPTRCLSCKGVRAGYGDAVVLDDVSLELPSNGSLAVLGRNGVGKSTLLLTIMGFTRLHRGKIFFAGEDITPCPPHRRAQLGLGWVAQEREIFPSLSVEENLTVAARPGRWDLAAVYELFPRLKERKGQHGQPALRRRAADARDRARADDQPGAAAARRAARGPGADHRRGAGRGAEEARRRWHRTLLVEQHTDIALALTQDAVVIERGRIVHRARSAEFARDEATLERYVGLKVA